MGGLGPTKHCWWAVADLGFFNEVGGKCRTYEDRGTVAVGAEGVEYGEGFPLSTREGHGEEAVLPSLTIF